jgi:hypothetical protein
MSRQQRIAILRFAFWAAILFSFTMAIVPQPPQLPGAPSDKVQHISAFLVLGGLVFFAYPRARGIYLGVGLSLFGALIELVQAIPGLHRDSDPIDWIADTVAAAAILVLLRWLVSRSNKGPAGKG